MTFDVAPLGLCLHYIRRVAFCMSLAAFTLYHYLCHCDKLLRSMFTNHCSCMYGCTPAGDMVWMPRADISELQSTALEGEEEYPDEFVAYLARYLLTYDDASKSYYSARLALPQVVAAAASSSDASSGELEFLLIVFCAELCGWC
jgi:hypothetical protein